jgi:hypothetical protein
VARGLDLGPGGRMDDGVWVSDAIAAGGDGRRRPTSGSWHGGFPVYEGLTQKLVQPGRPFDSGREHPDRIVARTLAICAGYAYSDASTLASIMGRVGLRKCRCRMIRASVDAMLIDTTAFLVQSEDGRVVILAYRGTPPTDVLCWLADAEVTQRKLALPLGHDGPFEVHSGFYRNARSVRYKIMEALARAAEGRPIIDPPDAGNSPLGALQKMEALYITGHSFGGALAALETLLMQKTPLRRERYAGALRATYTYGQPLVANRKLARWCDEDAFLSQRLLRFVHEHDPVPHLPPWDTGGYEHFGRMYQFRSGTWARRDHTAADRQMTSAASLLLSSLPFALQVFPAVRILQRLLPLYNFGDHPPQEYIDALTEPGELTELGDREPADGGTLAAAAPQGVVVSLPRPRS